MCTFLYLLKQNHIMAVASLPVVHIFDIYDEECAIQ